MLHLGWLNPKYLLYLAQPTGLGLVAGGYVEDHFAFVMSRFSRGIRFYDLRPAHALALRFVPKQLVNPTRFASNTPV